MKIDPHNKHTNPSELPAIAVPGVFDGRTHDKLVALDALRCGDVAEAFLLLGIDRPDAAGPWAIVEYHDSPEQFKLDMREMADWLSTRGL